MDFFVVISGCSGGGKSTLLTELGRRGYMTVEEPGRRIVKEELLGNGLALRVIHTIHQAMTHHRSYQIRYTGEGRCPRQKWIPAFAGKARRGRRTASTERSCALALPWVNEAAFARRAITLALPDRAKAIGHGGWVFFDRGLIDAAAALQHLTGEPVSGDQKLVDFCTVGYQQPGMSSDQTCYD